MTNKRSFKGSYANDGKLLKFTILWYGRPLVKAMNVSVKELLNDVSSSISIDIKVNRRSLEVTKALHVRKDSSFLNRRSTVTDF